MITTRSHIRSRSVAVLVAFIVAVLAVPALSGTGAGASVTAGKSRSVSLNVLAPTRGQVVTGPDLAVHVRVHGYRLDARYAGTPVIPGVGHFHTIIDGHLIDMSPVPPSSNRDTISMVGLQPGPHVLIIVPAWNDHMEATAAAVSVPFTYAGPYLPEPDGYAGTEAPSIALSAPANGSAVTGRSLTLTADIKNFVLCGDCYGKVNVAGEGHWHIFLDLPATAMDPMSMMPHMMTMASDATQDVSLKGVPAGRHTFTAVVVGNDHMPVMPMTMASVAVTVRSGPHHHSHAHN